MTEKRRVLFVCVANDARSPMAEALLRHTDDEHFEAFSAGIHPTAIDPRARDVLEHAGISVEGLRSKSIAEFRGQHFDYLIDLCDKSTDEGDELPTSSEVIVWNFVDPAHSEQHDPFRHTLQEISDRLKLFEMVKNRD
ncbi:arsenate reductase ArsC [Pseudomonas nitroreducens]|uniref:arsenate reductase ArsC n=1 Tax=Pseudomonas nitroreducens TaxID=46680 RepID=UPI0020A004C6|nr:arsenate reductase ArsC [Pseudomonas nitroreducens]MCP1626374.1 protein-tyrosine-phosphatase [Pseudomonas nitroreducens]